MKPVHFLTTLDYRVARSAEKKNWTPLFFPPLPSLLFPSVPSFPPLSSPRLASPLLPSFPSPPFPSLPLEVGLPFPPFLPLSPSLPLEVGPLNPARGSGGALEFGAF